ncbi:hypothetical protein FKB36_09460 [Methanoculleus sp. Afa-1]|uniref:Uncharacterized protein n=1 Tax=Methanoculleus formosensis TaxID=2590886 RepID=A0A9E4ZLP4_9EURY|nr:hypothetical protein [Methanoculleus sp. Afa-1]MCT8337702.1 hypothetical protein [Methanoculleus sp. Afa-1]
MNGNIGMRALSVLLAMLLVSAGVVSVVSATNNPQAEPHNTTFRLVDNVQPPLFDWSGVEPASPMTGSDLTTIILSEAYVAKQVGLQSPGIVELSLPFAAFGESDCSVEKSPDYLIQVGIAEDDPVAVLTIPDTMLRALNGDPGCIDLSFPLEYFSHYTDISTYYQQHPENTADRSRSKLSDSDLEAINSLEVNMERDVQPYLSRVRFMADSGNEVTYLTGKIRPYYYSNSGARYTIFQEREINLNRFDVSGEPLDTIEIVVEYEDALPGVGNIKLYPVVYDDNSNAIYPGPDPYIDVSRSSLPHEYNYYVSIGSGSTLGKYEIWIQDTTTEEWLGYYYYDDDSDPSQFIKRSVGSSELFLWDDSTFSFDARTSPIMDEWCRQGSTWDRPADVFSYYDRQYDSYVSTSYSTGSGIIYTHAYCSGSGSS